MDNVPVSSNEKGEVIIYDMKKSNYGEQPQYYQDPGNDQYYRKQMVTGRRVYVEEPPPPPINAARTPIIQGRGPPEEIDDIGIFENSFNSRKIRNRFIRKVYFLLFVSLGFTAGVIAVFVFEESVNRYAWRNHYVGMAFVFAAFGIYIALACVQSLRKQFPLNLFIFAIYTVVAAIGYGFVAALYAEEIVLYAALITAGVCLLITLIACQPWIDITGWGVYLCVIGMVAMIFGIVLMIISWTVGLSKVMSIIYASIMALVFSLYFMWTTQLILGGKKYEMSPEEYTYGAIVLYVEIMHLFILFLQLCGVARR